MWLLRVFTPVFLPHSSPASAGTTTLFSIQYHCCTQWPAHIRCSQHPSSPTMLRRSTVLLYESSAGEKTLGLLRARLRGSLRSCDVSEATCVQPYSQQCASQPHHSPVWPVIRSAIPSTLRHQVLTRNIFCQDVLLSFPDRRVSPPSVYSAVHVLPLILSSLRII